MRANLRKRLERLEQINAMMSIALYPDDSDGFISALIGDRKELYRKDNGYDVMAVLNDTAAEDWSGSECMDTD